MQPSLQIEFSPLFSKKLGQLSKNIIHSFKETLELFIENPDNEPLRKHQLRGKYSGYQSIDVTADYRAIFRETKTQTKTTIKFHLIGTHKELYSTEHEPN